MIIGLAGYARAGKDTVGEVLVKEHGYSRMAFADIMKEALVKLDPIVGFRWRGLRRRPLYLRDVILRDGLENAKAEIPEVRRLLQRLGTEMGREVFGVNFWVEQTFNKMDLTKDWALTDVRFPNEAGAITRAGGQVWRVERPGVSAPNEHLSEHALKGWVFDDILYNDGSLGDLHAKVAEMLPVGVA